MNKIAESSTRLPRELSKARLLVTVKTYPLPSGKYGELVCTAGLLNGEKWVRIYPIPLTFLTDEKKYRKYSWIELDLIRNERDFRPESYRPRQGIDENIQVVGYLDTANKWAARKEFILKEVFTSMDEVVKLAKSDQKKSLATLKPLEIVDFVIEEDERDWKDTWLAQSKQGNFFELDAKGQGRERRPVRKLPYKYSYKFLSEGDAKPRELAIQDWEIGSLFWNCLKKSEGDETAANRLVRQKYLDIFLKQKDLYLFLGTTKKHHNVAPNPFVIIGVFYPPKSAQISLL